LIQRHKERTERRCPHEAGGINGSGVRRRRVRKDVRAKKERLNPRGAQRRDFGKSNGKLWRADERGLSSVIIAAGRDHRNCTSMIGAGCIGVNAPV